MNDRFKFRAWVIGHYFSENDEEKEILIKLNDVTVYNDGTIGIDYHSLLESVCSLLKNESERDSLLEYFEEKNLTTGDDWYYLEAKFIEQCTGLKDKNGRLIYEGDIVQHDTAAGPKCWPVLFKDGCFVLPYESGNAWLGKVIQNCPYSSGVVVVGNIHDNADLLEGGNEQTKI